MPVSVHVDSVRVFERSYILIHIKAASYGKFFSFRKQRAQPKPNINVYAGTFAVYLYLIIEIQMLQ